MFTSEDIDRLRGFMSSENRFVTTPQVLSETDNFIDNAPSHRRVDLRRTLGLFTQSASEMYVPSSELAKNAAFEIVGLSDTSLVHASKEVLVVTIDQKLAAQIYRQNGNVQLFGV